MSVDLASGVTGALATRDQADRVRVLRALLRTPVLRAHADPELFRLARRHADELREWLTREVGWRLVVEPQIIRLVPSYVPHGPTAVGVAARHPARVRRGDPPFTRRRYVLLCLALAVLERSDLQIALGRLAEEILLMMRSSDLDGIEFNLTRRDERTDLVAAIRVLLVHGVLVRVAGDEEAYLSSGGDALYDIDRRMLAAFLATTHPPALVERTLGRDAAIEDLEAALHAPPVTYTDEEANRRLRQTTARRLLCDPVVYYDELPEAERAYLLSGQRVSLARRLADATGLVPELRAEGLALVDPDDQVTDLRMPEQGTDGHATLLLAEHLAERGSAGVGELRALVRQLAIDHAAYWRRTTREPGAEVALVDEAVARLVGLGLARVSQSDDDAVVIGLPALRRFAVGAPVVAQRSRA